MVNTLLGKIKTDSVFRNYILFFVGSIGIAFLNYIFHPILGHLLAPADFGELQAFIALVGQSAIIFGAFSVVTVNITANTDDVRERNAILSELQKIALVAGFFVLCILLLTLSSVQEFFNFNSSFVLLALAASLPLSAMSTFRNGFLQGSGDFTRLSIGGVLSAGSKIIFAVALFYFGFGVTGSILGIVLASSVSFVYLLYVTRNSLELKLKSDVLALKSGSVKKELKYGVLVFFATSLIIVLYTTDVLIAKRSFTSEEAGLYSGISAIAKIIFFAIAPIAGILLSVIKVKNSYNENITILGKALAVAVTIGTVGVFTFYLFSGTIVKLMIGEAYVPYAHLLPEIGIVMFLASILNILLTYYLALRRYFLIIPSILGIAVVGVLLLVRQSSVLDMLKNLTIIILISITILLIAYAKDHLYNRPRL